jgi:hypothetical protein
LEFIWNLACLREAASAKAGACYLVLIQRINHIRKQIFFQLSK